MPTEIHLFDFDGTLFRSPEPPTGWTGKSWWTYPGSLEPPCIPEKPGADWWISSTVAQARKSISDPDVWAVLATGRRDSIFRWRVPELLKHGGLSFDEVHLSPGDTLPFKKALLLKLLNRFPFVERVRLWDDRANHIAEFESMLQRLGVGFETTAVRATPMPTTCEVTSQEVRVASRWLAARAPTEVLYVGAFLTPMSRQRLLRDFPPTHDQVHADHMTIWFEPSDDLVEQLALGRQVRLKVIGIADDGKGQAVVVRPEGVKPGNRSPHITVSTVTGVSASYSNQLIERGWKTIVGPTLTAVLDTFPRSIS